MPKRTATKRRIMKEFLQLYETQPCLWNRLHSDYNKKESREKAYELLREKYSELDQESTIAIIKKKIEHMRSAYKRENKKVIAYLVSGRQYVPSLWYYEHLSFIDVKNDVKPSTDFVSETTQDSDDDELPEKKSKMNNIYLEDPVEEDRKSIYLEDEEERKNEPACHYDDRARRESEAFGKTVGLQLSELSELQRYLAEKLISDVIYLARVEQLNEETTVGNDR